ncbi:hypothetical protein ACTXT7_008603 [Hymenolepis weldensis]
MSMNGDSQFAAVWSNYSENLMEAVKEPEDILTFRTNRPEKFRSICASQLSFVLETPFNILSDLENQNNIKGTPMKQLLSRTRRKFGGKLICMNHNVLPPSSIHKTLAYAEVETMKRLFRVSKTSLFTHKSASRGGSIMESLFLSDDLQPLKLTSTLLNRLSYLMTVLENSGALCVEGIFRKTGSLTQQRAIADSLLHSDFNCTTFPWHEYSAHELAGALKSIISHLDQPLLTSGLTPFYLQAASESNELCVPPFACPLMSPFDYASLHYSNHQVLKHSSGSRQMDPLIKLKALNMPFGTPSPFVAGIEHSLVLCEIP